MAVAGSGKYAAKLETQYAFIKLAAGNIYTGKFVGLVGVKGAEIDWGVPFTSRPTSLKVWYKYQPKIIDQAQAPYESQKGKVDVCQIQVFLTDWDKPKRINNTLPDGLVDFSYDNKDIIAYGKFEPEVSLENSMTEYDDFVIDLEYRDLTRKPKYIVITACASRSSSNWSTTAMSSRLQVSNEIRDSEYQHASVADDKGYDEIDELRYGEALLAFSQQRERRMPVL